jgi:hypothetical protein
LPVTPSTNLPIHSRDLGVWEWGDLEIDECCPFCGCLCGMAFQEASQMYHCISCDALTDFSELRRRGYE